MREDLKKVFLDVGQTVAWVDFTKGDDECRLRFPGEGLAKTALNSLEEANEGQAKIKGKDVQARVLEGAEEVEHWSKFFTSQREIANSKRKGRQHQKGRRGNYKVLITCTQNSYLLIYAVFSLT
jgi:hypothetical protein